MDTGPARPGVAYGWVMLATGAGLLIASLLGGCVQESAELPTERTMQIGDSKWVAELPEPGRSFGLTGTVSGSAGDGIVWFRTLDLIDGVQVMHDLRLDASGDAERLLAGGLSKAWAVEVHLEDGRIVADAVTELALSALPYSPWAHQSSSVRELVEYRGSEVADLLRRDDAATGGPWLALDEAAVRGTLVARVGSLSSGPPQAAESSAAVLVQEMYAPTSSQGVAFLHVIGVCIDGRATLATDGQETNLLSAFDDEDGALWAAAGTWLSCEVRVVDGRLWVDSATIVPGDE